MKSGFLLSKAERQARGIESKEPAPSHHELLSGRALVTSLVEHSMKLLHHDLEGFFEADCQVSALRKVPGEAQTRFSSRRLPARSRPRRA